jgi:glycosyltransferase involved in cell wall biosynthesis
MRVAQLGPYPPPHGGVQTNLVAIRHFLLAGGHQCLAVNLTRFRPSNPAADADGVYYPESAAGLAWLLFRLPVDIVHLHFGGDLTARLLALAFLATLLPGRKTVLTFHSGGYPSSPAGQTASPGTLRGFVLRRLDGLIAVNAEIAALFRKFGVRPERIRTILPFAIKPPDPALQLPDGLRHFTAAHQPLLLTVGLLEPEYDLPLQIDTMEDVLRRFPEAGLVIVGAGSLEAVLRQRIGAKPYAERLLLWGDLPHATTLRLMLQSAALLRTTLYDGDSVSVREALYIGTPVIASDNGMRPPGVRLIPVSNRDQLRDAIFEVLEGSLPRQAAAGDGQENIRQVVDFYKELLSRAESRPPAA